MYPTSVIALRWVICTVVLVHLAASNCTVVYSLPKYSSYYYKKNIAGTFRTYMHSTESRLARSIDYTESSIPYYCHVRIGAATWFKSFTTQLSHFLAGSFAFSVSVSLLVHSSIPRIIATFTTSWAWNPWLQLRVCMSKGHLMMTSMKPNHSNHLATVYKHIRAPPWGMLLVYNPSSLGRYLTNTCIVHT